MATQRRFEVEDRHRVSLTRHLMGLMRMFDDRRGSIIDPDDVLSVLQALRESRVRVIPLHPPFKVVKEPWDDWSDLSQVPLAALGLRVAVYKQFMKLGLDNVGLVTCHSEQGLAASGVRIGPVQMDDVKDCLLEAPVQLELAQDNTKVPMTYVIEHWLMFDWWSLDDQRDFARRLRLNVLEDVSRLTPKRIQKVPFGKYTHTEQRSTRLPTDPTNPQHVEMVVKHLNDLLSRYGLSPIPTA